MTPWALYEIVARLLLNLQKDTSTNGFAVHKRHGTPDQERIVAPDR
jgi:hypothetical protein